MKRTTIYLPNDLKALLERAAQSRGCSEAALIREGLRQVLADEAPPSPRIPLFSSGQSDLAERVDELLEGFGDT